MEGECICEVSGLCDDFTEGGVIVFCDEFAGGVGVGGDVAVGVIDGEVGAIVAGD